MLCRLNISGKWSDGCIHDVSNKGLLISCTNPPAIGTYVDIRRGTLVIIGRVVWKGGSRFGVQTQDPVNIAALVNEPVLKSRPSASRRSLTREKPVQSVTQRAERNRQRSSTIQFVCVVMAALGIAYFAAISCYQALAVPLGTIANALGGGGAQ
ncbi:hypothetical protein [Sphingomonas sp. LR55]|uniref:hypothetical protein n=1 Tax=Sphingomonas sp. LR55 TaxID=3050231 RepID=UPI003FA74CA5